MAEGTARAPATLGAARQPAPPARTRPLEAAKLAELQIGSALIVALRAQGKPAGFLALAHALPRGAWDVNLQLLMKLIGTSLATGLERIRIEARLAKLEERTNLFQAAANDGLWDFDVESNEVYFSPRWKAMLGYGDDDMRGSPDWRSLVHPDDLARVQAAIRDHVAGKTPIFESTHRMRHRNGEWRWVISRATARVDKHGRLLRLVGVELDITERKLYEEALFREKESAQITLQSIGDGVITTDANSTIDYINPVAEELTGWRLEDAMGRPGGGDLPRLPRGDLRAARESAVGVDPPHPPHQVGAADAADPTRWQRALCREHRGADPRWRGPRGRRSAGVPRCE